MAIRNNEEHAMTQSVGILAYGSLIADPGPEIGPRIIERRSVETPFPVEFARKSAKRAGAPTLVPVSEGGARVMACILVLKASSEEAANMLYRREINDFDPALTYKPKKNPGPNVVVVMEHKNLYGIDIVFSTRIGANIESLSPQKLASLAIKSAHVLDDGRDGISYLINAKRHGITTALSSAYEEEIKKKLGASDLEEALRIIASQRKTKAG